MHKKTVAYSVVYVFMHWKIFEINAFNLLPIGMSHLFIVASRWFKYTVIAVLKQFEWVMVVKGKWNATAT